MDIYFTWYILLAAFALDFILGDPRWMPHPIRWMGNAIDAMEPLFRSLIPDITVAGGIFAVTLIGGTWIITYTVIALAYKVHPALSVIIEIILIYYCISAKSLEKAAMDVSNALKAKNLEEAKQKVSMIVGRETGNLSEDGVARAATETVAENLVDGFISPIFFAAIGGSPMAMAYKMINTLDSMVGYKNETYFQFGKVAAKIDDIANFIPARLSVSVIAFAAQILYGKGKRAFKTAFVEGSNHASPNAGYSEAAFAGALAIRLGGPNCYHGSLVEKPYIGTRFGRIKIDHIKKACDLMLLSSVIWTGILSLILFMVKL
ncbi:MAG: adenosylcobinamide-phosphate synthase CbiB [Desulfobacterales bacterium]|nr:adenosylcobinamide-phosphate synthase CbiB [Desulfobacterales bacterium]